MSNQLIKFCKGCKIRIWWRQDTWIWQTAVWRRAERRHMSHEDKMLSCVAGDQRAALGLPLFRQILFSTFTALYNWKIYSALKKKTNLFKIVQQWQFTAVACILIPNRLFFLRFPIPFGNILTTTKRLESYWRYTADYNIIFVWLTIHLLWFAASFTLSKF